MDFLGFSFAPADIAGFLAAGVATGTLVGCFFVVVTLAYGRRS